VHDRRIDSDTVISCPYLGLASDPSTHCPFATSSHRCFRWPTPQPVENRHQLSFCLSADYSSCHWYTQAEGRGARLGRGRGARPGRGRALPEGWGRPAAAIAALCVVALLLVVLQPWSLLSPSSTGADRPAAAAQTAVSTPPVAGIISPETPPTATPPPTVQPTPATPEGSPAAAPAAPAASPQPGARTATPRAAAATPARATSTVAPGVTATPVPTATLPPGTQAYFVKQGDNLYDIAKLFGVTVDDIMKANGLTDRSYLRVGQRLAIPEASR